MGTKTTRLDLTKPGENDYYNQQTEQADNWQKVDDYAVYTDRDKNAIWGGLDGGGLIEDPSVTKVVGKRYIGADGKAYICLAPSNINNSTNYTPCNVVDNLDKLQNLSIITAHSNELVSVKRADGTITYTGVCRISNSGSVAVKLPIPLVFFNGMKQAGVTATHTQSDINNRSVIYAVGFYVADETTIKFNATSPFVEISFVINGFWKNPLV